jgi:DNA-binding PadR family transcriptional regulator
VIRGFILYYLNIKPTHGYDIQKFLQISGMEQWAKIQSGSIYYALTKLEKEKFIRVLKEERTGTRARKIYEITTEGRKEMQKELAEELEKPLWQVSTMKFITGPMLSTLSREECTVILKRHINGLKEQLDYWIKWKDIKIGEQTDGLDRLSFQITIDSIKGQIIWHEELLKNLEHYIKSSEQSGLMIKNFDFDRIVTEQADSEVDEKLNYIHSIKNEILKDPDNAIVNLDKIIEELSKQKKK